MKNERDFNEIIMRGLRENEISFRFLNCWCGSAGDFYYILETETGTYNFHGKDISEPLDSILLIFQA